MNNTPDFPVQSVADPELALNETESILAQAQSDPSLSPEAWWPEDKTAASEVQRSSAPLLPETYDAAQAAISPQASRSVITSGDGFRNGYFACTDPNGTMITLSDNITPAEVPLHTMQGSVIQGHSTASDVFTLISDYHHVMVDSILITGGGYSAIDIIKTRESKNLPPDTQEEFEALAQVTGKGFGMVNSSILASESDFAWISIQADICGVYGAHSPGATSIATGRGDDTISIESWGGGIYKGSIHAGDGNDSIDILAWDGPLVYDSVIHLGDGNDTLNLFGSWSDYGYVHDSIILTGKGNDLIYIENMEVDGPKGHNVLDNSHIILAEGTDTLTIKDAYGQRGVLSNSSIFLEDYTGNAGSKTISIVHSSGSYATFNANSALDTSEINLGNGNDSISIISKISSGAAITDSYILTAEGNDTLDVTVSFKTNSGSSVVLGPAMDNAYVNMGDGNDQINITGDVLRSDLYAGSGNDVVNINGAVTSSTVSLGSGNDVLHLSATPGGVAATPGSTGATLDGGTNTALSYGQGELGDILSLDQSYFTHFKSAPLTTIRNFEALNLDFSDGQRNALDLDSLLSGMKTSTLKSANFSSLIISGDTGGGKIYDSIDLGGNATYKGGNISVDGMDQTYNWYTAYEGTSQQMEVFVATGMLIA